MKRLLINNLSLWQFNLFANESSIKHFVTDRNKNENSIGFTLSYSSSPDKGEIGHNRKQLANAIGITTSQLIFPSQVHKARVVNVTQHTIPEELMETDALITNQNGLCIAVMTADCVPVLLYDKKNNAVAAVHAGWRGTVSRILEKTLQEMKAHFGTKGEDLIAGIGPSVCQESYEVGQEVIEAVNLAFGQKNSLMIRLPGNKAKFDLWEASKLQLLEFGVSPSNIEVSDLCTVKTNNHFFSARKGDSGRFATGIMLI